MIIVAPLTPRLSARIGANRAVAVGMASVGARRCSASGGSTRPRRTGRSWSTCCLFVVGDRAHDVADDGGDHVGGAGPRAGAGSAMNDATRELGAALGVAVLGSSRHALRPRDRPDRRPGPCRPTPPARPPARSPMRWAPPTPCRRPRVPRSPPPPASAFLDGVHVSVVIASALAATTALVVLRYLPRTVRHLESAISSSRPTIVRTVARPAGRMRGRRTYAGQRVALLLADVGILDARTPPGSAVRQRRCSNVVTSSRVRT